MSSTRVSHHVKAPRALVYRALLDPEAVASCEVDDVADAPQGARRSHPVDKYHGGANARRGSGRPPQTMFQMERATPIPLPSVIAER
jgi:hypothetical protein